jgi:hypothetical protein
VDGARTGERAPDLLLVVAPCRYRGGMQSSRRLDDDDLAEEIELYGDLVVAASESDTALSTAEIDRLLGVTRQEH